MASGAERRRRQRARETGEIPPLAPDQLPPGTDVPFVPPELRETLPWETWTNGESHVVDPAVYGLTVAALRRRLHRHAARSGLLAHTTRRGDDVVFSFESRARD